MSFIKDRVYKTRVEKRKERVEAQIRKREKEENRGNEIVSKIDCITSEEDDNDDDVDYKGPKTKYRRPSSVTLTFQTKNLGALTAETLQRGDYKEIVELTLLFLGGNVPVFKSKHPGALHHARFMAKCI